MALLPEIEKRRALRAYSEEPIDKEVLTRLAEAAHHAPSNENAQPWRIITVVEPNKLEAFRKTLSDGNYWAKKAPAISAFVTNPSWSKPTEERDLAFFELGMAAMAYQLQATHENLIAHPITGFNHTEAKKVLGIGENERLEVLIVVGRPGEVSSLNEQHQKSEKAPRQRKPLKEILAFDAWDPHLDAKSKD
jgi:nitroreductase